MLSVAGGFDLTAARPRAMINQISRYKGDTAMQSISAILAAELKKPQAHVDAVIALMD